MKISIVTPVFNDVRVGHALASIFGQLFDHDLESIVIDAGSRDGTLEVLERYRKQVAVMVSEPDRGIFEGMNKGLARATGDVIGILNSDDRYNDAYVLRDVMDAFERQDADICYGNIVYVNQAGREVRYFESGPHRRFKWRLGWMPPHPAFFVRSRVYADFGMFKPELRVAGDYELMLRLLFKYELKTAYINRVFVQMATGGNANRSLGNFIQGAQDVRSAWRLNDLPGGQFVPFLKPVSKIGQLWRRSPKLQRSEDPESWAMWKGENS